MSGQLLSQFNMKFSYGQVGTIDYFCKSFNSGSKLRGGFINVRVERVCFVCVGNEYQR